MKNIYKLLGLTIILFTCSVTSHAQTDLSSNPTSTFVLYLDFDGHSDNSGWWSSTTFPDPIVTAASSFTPAQITEVFNRTSEDFRPFDINVTTSASVYNAALVAKRQRIVITSTSQFYTDENGGAGGVAYLNTFGGGEIAGYVFSNFLGASPKRVAEACSHEAGHTLGLNHHSSFTANCIKDQEYNPGQGSVETDWAPIMGNSYNSNMSLWYHGATNKATCTTQTQDDLAVIITNNGFTYRPDDFGNTIATSSLLTLVNNTATKKGIITTRSDIDVHKIVVTTAGIYSLKAVPNSHNLTGNVGANLDIKLWVTNGEGTILATANPELTLDAGIANLSLPAGSYYIFIDGVGVDSYTSIGGLGALDYGSIGEYTLTANRECTPVITSTTPGSRCGAGMVTLGASASAGTINWYGAATGGTSLGTGASFITPSLFATKTYYVGSTLSGCGSPSVRVPVVATINTTIPVNAGPDQIVYQNTGSINLTGSPSGGTWSGTNVSASGVFNTNIAPGQYTLTYCATSGGCSGCDEISLTVLSAETQVELPLITPETGTYGAAQTVSISCATSGAAIYYTLTGNTPVIGTGFTKLYSGPFVVNQSITVKAIGVKAGLINSGISRSIITLSESFIVAAPVITPGTGSYSGQQSVTISCSTPGASIYYTTNGNVPSESLNSFTKLYTSSFLVNSTTTIRAFAFASGKVNSPVSVAVITITSPTTTVATPVITPSTGTFSGAQMVSISCITAGATIYYTTSGNIPIIGAGFTKVYSGPFQMASSGTVRAMGVKSGSINSGVAVSYITILGARPEGAEDLDEEEFTREQSAEFAIYPNPSQGNFRIITPPREIGYTWNATVYDMKGQVLKTFSLQNQDEPLDLSNRPSGMYMLILTDGNETRNYRLVKQ